MKGKENGQKGNDAEETQVTQQRAFVNQSSDDRYKSKSRNCQPDGMIRFIMATKCG